jgi:cation:H+ antiporter
VTDIFNLLSSTALNTISPDYALGLATASFLGIFFGESKAAKTFGIFSAAAALLLLPALSGATALGVGLAAGIALLKFGGSLFIDHASHVAKRLGLPASFIGIFLVGFGTSFPELAASIGFAQSGADAAAITNVTGSNFANYFLILPLTLLMVAIHNWLSPPKPAAKAKTQTEQQYQAAKKEFLDQRSANLALGQNVSALDIGFFGLSAALLTTLAYAPMLAPALGITPLITQLGLMSGITSPIGWVFLSLLAGYGALKLLTAKPDPIDPNASTEKVPNVFVSLAFAFAGLGLLVWGAGVVVSSSLGIAAAYGLSQGFVGATLVAVGTSLPEMMAGFFAITRGKKDLAAGNLLGSGIFNILGILGTSAIAKGGMGMGGLAIAGVTVPFVGIMALATTAIFIGMLNKNWKVGVGTGIAMAAIWLGVTLADFNGLVAPWLGGAAATAAALAPTAPSAVAGAALMTPALG